MFARVIIVFVSLVLLWTGFPPQEQSETGARAIIDIVEVVTDAAGKADLQRHAQDSPVGNNHLDAQPYAESGADLSELIPVRQIGMAPARVPGWEGSGAVHAQVPPYLDGPQRPPDTARRIA